MKEVKTTSIREWEEAEKQRSISEAERRGLRDLIMTPKNIARYLSPSSDSLYPNEYCFYLLGDIQGKLTLDLGCGDGEHTVLLAARGAKVMAIDISLPLLRRWGERQRVNQTTQVFGSVASAHQLPFPDESVDAVFGTAILHHLDLSLAKAEVLRVLRRGGTAVFREPVRDSKVVDRIRKLIPYQGDDVSPFERPLTTDELSRFAEGFSQFTCKSFRLPFVGFAEIIPSLRWLAAPFNRLSACLLGSFPFLARYATFKVIKVIK